MSTQPECRGRMRTRLSHPTPAFHGRRADSARVRPELVDEHLSRRWGCKPKTAKHHRLRIQYQAIDVVEVFLAIGAAERADDFAGPIQAALVPADVEALAAVIEAAYVDGAEDPLVAVFLANPCAETARPLHRKKIAEAVAHLRAAHALGRQFGLHQ